MAKGKGRTKNLRYGAEGDLFMDDIQSVIDDEELEPVFEIDTTALDENADNLASSIIANIAKVYASEDFLKNNPDFKKRLDAEVQSLKIHYKIRAVDERIQDELVRAIGRKGDNASLYMALPKLQSQITATQTKIDQTIDRIQNLLNGYQTKINFDNEEETEEGEDNTNLHSSTNRGAKSFIEKYKNVSYSDIIEEDEEKDD